MTAIAYDMPPRFAAVHRAVTDPDWYERQRREGQAKIDALFAAHTARVRAQQEARWAAEEQGEA